jgi:hypothetical protein
MKINNFKAEIFSPLRGGYVTVVDIFGFDETFSMHDEKFNRISSP